MLDEFADIVDQDLAGMSPRFGSGEVVIMGFGPLDDGRDGDGLTVMITEPVPDIGIVIRGQPDLGVLDHVLLDPQFPKDVVFDFRSDGAGGFPSPIGNGEAGRVLSIGLEQSEKTPAADLEDSQDMGEIDLFLEIAAQESPDLLVPEGLVQVL